MRRRRSRFRWLIRVALPSLAAAWTAPGTAAAAEARPVPAVQEPPVPAVQEPPPAATRERPVPATRERPAPVAVSDETVPSFASPFLEADHWAHDALRRLHGLALLPRGYDPSTRSLTRREAGWLLARAEAAAGGGPPAGRGRDPRLDPGAESHPVAELATGYRARFAEEFPATAAYLARGETDPRAVGGPAPDGARGAAGGAMGAADAGRPVVRAEGAVQAGARHRDGVVLARHWTRAEGGPTGGVEPVSDGTDPVWRVESAVLLGPGTAPLAARVALGNAARPEDPAAGVDLQAAYAALEAGDLVLWAGRRRPGFGPAYGGTVLLTGAEPVDGAGLVLADGARPPGFLGDALGPIRLEVFGARLERSGPIDHPWLFGWRLSISPADGLRLAIDRAGMFGGENHPVPTTLGRVVSAVLGNYSAEEGEGLNFENGLASGELWWRLPRGAPPLSLYLEWGFEDWAGAWVENPGMTFGAELAALPGVPQASLGLEGAWFRGPGDEPGTNRTWYLHGAFSDNWTLRGRPLAHPLGGHGWEARLRGRADLLAARLRADAHLLRRNRGETNLYAPEREGESAGVGGGLAWRASPALELFGRGAAEWGEEWSRAAGSAGLRATF